MILLLFLVKQILLNLFHYVNLQWTQKLECWQWSNKRKYLWDLISTCGICQINVKSKHKKHKFQTAHIKKLNVRDWTDIKPSMIGIEYLNLNVRDTHFWENKCVIIKVFTDLWVLNGQGGGLIFYTIFPFFRSIPFFPSPLKLSLHAFHSDVFTLPLPYAVYYVLIFLSYTYTYVYEFRWLRKVFLFMETL